MANHSNVLESPGQRSLGWGLKSWTRLSAIFVFFLSSLCLYVSSTIINTINPWINVCPGVYDFFFLKCESFFFFYFTILYWFCHTSTCIRHRCTRVPHPEPPSHLPPHTIPLGHPSAPAPSFLYPASNLAIRFLIWYYTCFNAILPNHSTPSLSHRVRKTVLYICVSFAVSHIGLSLPSF